VDDNFDEELDKVIELARAEMDSEGEEPLVETVTLRRRWVTDNQYIIEIETDANEDATTVILVRANTQWNTPSCDCEEFEEDEEGLS
jgi:hypothetical protein